MRIDLHTHSSASDGTGSPSQVVRDARAAGLDVVGLTDHDTTSGWAEAAHEAERAGVALVRGTEVSALAGGVSVHLLSYLQDPTAPVLADVLARTRDSREHRAERMVARLAAGGVPVTWADVLLQAKDAVAVGRPHIADALVELGVVPDRSAAFVDLLSARGPYYVGYAAPTAVDAVRAVVAAGGVPVFAHPGADGRGRVVADDVIEEMAEAGLVALEVDHRDHSPAQRDRLRVLANRLGLLVTGSSDYHGAGKPNVLGENLTDPAVLAAIEERGSMPVVRP
ncbi:MAG: phosphatase [Cellulomonas sp. 73-145]|uniref:PHP domain-containing protein n=1 Tax=Cellulomonas sp. 73-145 TaxID=1895739 RepID=UPI00092665B6|nr:PHP domain-containing protein [Cellulomonas sp. 73-145]OJV60733.1 MAG: phosphatase [Cellulomonas sp. 73-145]